MIDHRAAAYGRTSRIFLPGVDHDSLHRVLHVGCAFRFGRGGANVTAAVLAAVQREGTCWMSGTEWDGEPAMRISVSNWRTSEDDIRRSADAIESCMRQPLLAKE